MARLFNDPFFQAIDGNGVPYAGALLYFYITGTTTPKNTYSNPDLDISHVNANPVEADANGRFGAIYLATDAEYKTILKTAAGVTVATRDPLSLISPSVIAHEGALILGNALGADSELVIGAANRRLTSTGTTAEWRAPNFTRQVFTSGSGTYTTPTNCTAIRVRIKAGGGGGGGSGGTTGPNGAAGVDSSFGAITAIKGSGGIGNAASAIAAGGAGGTGGAGTAFRQVGQAGHSVIFPGVTAGWGGPGGGAGGGPSVGVASGAGPGAAGKANTGGGGSGSTSAGTTQPAGGGGEGEYAEFIILTPAASYAYAVGSGGAGGIGTGTAAATGGAGGSGYVIVEEFYG
jgi:hypothetical protein